MSFFKKDEFDNYFERYTGKDFADIKSKHATTYEKEADECFETDVNYENEEDIYEDFFGEGYVEEQKRVAIEERRYFIFISLIIVFVLLLSWGLTYLIPYEMTFLSYDEQRYLQSSDRFYDAERIKLSTKNEYYHIENIAYIAYSDNQYKKSYRTNRKYHIRDEEGNVHEYELGEYDGYGNQMPVFYVIVDDKDGEFFFDGRIVITSELDGQDYYIAIDRALVIALTKDEAFDVFPSKSFDEFLLYDDTKFIYDLDAKTK